MNGSRGCFEKNFKVELSVVQGPQENPSNEVLKPSDSGQWQLRFKFTRL